MNKLVRSCLPLAALMAFPLATAGNIGYASPDAALAALRDMPDTTIREENDWLVAHDKANATLWSITTDKHPAHPTAVKRTLTQHDGAVVIKTNVMCGAQKDVCDKVVQQFEQINDGLRQAMQDQH
jgi:UDP-N-acetylglucosamine enolpyruvyl transferase